MDEEARTKKRKQLDSEKYGQQTYLWQTKEPSKRPVGGEGVRELLKSANWLVKGVSREAQPLNQELFCPKKRNTNEDEKKR